MQISQTGEQVWRSLTAWPQCTEQRSHPHPGACSPLENGNGILRGLGKTIKITTGTTGPKPSCVVCVEEQCLNTRLLGQWFRRQ